MKRLAVDIPEELHDALRVAVVARKCSAADIVRGLLERDLRRVQWPPIDMSVYPLTRTAQPDIT
jgi:hypothetical protein